MPVQDRRTSRSEHRIKIKWGLAGFDNADKELQICGPTWCEPGLDSGDDVSPQDVAPEFAKICRILNDHWYDPKYKTHRCSHDKVDVIMEGLAT